MSFDGMCFKTLKQVHEKNDQAPNKYTRYTHKTYKCLEHYVELLIGLKKIKNFITLTMRAYGNNDAYIHWIFY